MQEQNIINISNEDYSRITDYILKNNIKSIMLVCDNSIEWFRINEYFINLEKSGNIDFVRFSNFKPNPLYESIVEGVKVLNTHKCDLIIAVGGGSAMDVAKCIKLYSNMNHDVNYLKQKIVPNTIKLMAMPTTAGTGSEATRYAVIYYKGEKQSVSDDTCIPETVIMDASVLKTLPEYQKKSTMMDAFCHAIESFWSVNSTEQSKKYSKEAIELIISNKDLYLNNDDKGNMNMLIAANIAGKAINITQTTAGHAMCYKLTSLYGIAHGHGAALCINVLLPYMANHINDCIDERGNSYLEEVFNDIAVAMGAANINEAAKIYSQFLDSLCLQSPIIKSEQDFEILTNSVNPVRLKNNPVKLGSDTINTLYHNILDK